MFSVRCELKPEETVDITVKHDRFARCLRYLDVYEVSFMIDCKPVAKVRTNVNV